MKISNLSEKLLYLIIDTSKTLAFGCYDVKNNIDKNLQGKVWKNFYTELDLLYAEYGTALKDATSILLYDDSGLLTDEELQIKLECANIWSIDELYTYVHNIRYYLSLADENDIAHLKNRLLIGCVQRSDSTINDPAFVYTKWMNRILSSNDTYTENIRRALNNLSLDELVTTVEGAILFAEISALKKPPVHVPSNIKKVYDVVREMSWIQLDGLILWGQNSGFAKLKRIIVCLKAIKSSCSAGVLSEYFAYLLSIGCVDSRTYKTKLESLSESEAECIRNFEKHLYNSFDMDECIKLSDEYLHCSRQKTMR